MLGVSARGGGERLLPTTRFGEAFVRRNFIRMALLFSLNHGCITSLLNLSYLLLGARGAFQSGVLYVTYALTALVASASIVAHLGSRRALIASSSLYCLYVMSFPMALLIQTKDWFAHADSRDAAQTVVAVSGGAIGGIAAGFLWAAQGSYFAQTAKLYALDTNSTPESASSQFAATFGVIFLGMEVVLKVLPLALKTFEGAYDHHLPHNGTSANGTAPPHNDTASAANGTAAADGAAISTTTSELIVAVAYSILAVASAVGMTTVADLDRPLRMNEAEAARSDDPSVNTVAASASSGGAAAAAAPSCGGVSTAVNRDAAAAAAAVGSGGGGEGARVPLRDAAPAVGGLIVSPRGDGDAALPKQSQQPQQPQLPQLPPPAATAAAKATPKVGLRKLASAMMLWWQQPAVLLLAPVQATFGVCATLLAFEISGIVCPLAFPEDRAVAAGLLSAMLSAIAAALQIPFKRIAARHGKGPIMHAGLLSFAGLGLMVFLLDSKQLAKLVPLISCYTLQAIGRACYEGTNKALYADLFPEHAEAAFSNIVLANGLASAISSFTFPYLSRQARSLAALASACFAMVCYCSVSAVHRRHMRVAEGDADRI